MSRRSNWGGGLLLVVTLGLSAGATSGCRDDDDVVRAAGGNAGVTAAAGRHAGGEGGTPSAIGDGGRSGATGAAGAAGAQCDCGSDVNHASIPLQCACAAGLCTTFEDDLPKYRSGEPFGLPYYVWLGTCAAGYHTLSYDEATEQSGTRTYDSTGRMVYDLFGGYGAAPKACGFHQDFGPGTLIIGGADPANACRYCMLARNEGTPSADGGARAGAGGGGASGRADSGTSTHADLTTPPCDPSLFE